MDVRALPLTQERIKKRAEFDPDTGCWNWSGVLHKQGYGMIRSGRTHHLTHRASYKVFKGEIPEGLFVCHRCDNRKCVNPDHLFLGTVQDNQQDMKSKDRSMFGEKSSAAKLKESDVLQILSLRGGMTQRAIAKMFNVSPALICMILKGAVWQRTVRAA